MVSDTAAAAKRLAVAAVPDIAPAALAMPALTAPASPTGQQSQQDRLLAELILLRQALSSLTVVDSDGALVGRMRVEAQREIGVLGDLVRARR